MQENAETICYGSGMKIKSWDQKNLRYILWNGLHLKGIILRHLGMIYGTITRNIILGLMIPKKNAAVYNGNPSFLYGMEGSSRCQ